MNFEPSSPYLPPPELFQPPPAHPQAEQSVLGGVLINGRIFDDVAEVLSGAEFSSPAHRAIFAGMRTLHASGQPVDVLTVAEQLSRTGELLTVGGVAYLSEICGASIAAASAVHYAHLVAEYAQRREVISAGLALVSGGHDLGAEMGDVLESARRNLDAAEPTEERGGGTPVEETAWYLERLERLATSGQTPGLPTPFSALDRITAGLQPGEVGVIAARPGNGKTALALSLASYAANNEYPTGFISLEMSRDQLRNRIFAAGAHVDAQRFRNGHFPPEDLANIRHYANQHGAAPLMIDDFRGHKPSTIRRTLRTWQRRNGLRLLLIDYLQLVTPDTRARVREVEVAEMSRAIKIMAGEFGVPIWLLVQVSREAVKDSRGLRLHHLRESGAIEQDADIVLLIQPWDPKSPGDGALVTIDVAKSRSSATGSFQLVYHKRYVDFKELAFGE